MSSGPEDMFSVHEECLAHCVQHFVRKYQLFVVCLSDHHTRHTNKSHQTFHMGLHCPSSNYIPPSQFIPYTSFKRYIVQPKLTTVTHHEAEKEGGKKKEEELEDQSHATFDFMTPNNHALSGIVKMPQI
jgi:hypothetical protein